MSRRDAQLAIEARRQALAISGWRAARNRGLIGTKRERQAPIPPEPTDPCRWCGYGRDQHSDQKHEYQALRSNRG